MGHISAARIEDRTAYIWEEWDVQQNLAPDWYSDVTIGPCKAWRNRYCVVINLCLRRENTFPEDPFLDVTTLPVGWRPTGELWDTRMSVEGKGQGILSESRILTNGLLQVATKAGGFRWQIQTRTPVYFCYPRSNT